MIKQENLIAALRRMAQKKEPLICQGCGYEHNCSLHGCAVLKAAADRLTELSAPPPNPPLTLDELREMDGEPVYLDFGGILGEYVLVRVEKKRAFLRHKNGILSPAKLAFRCAGQIYRRKPEEAAHGN